MAASADLPSLACVRPLRNPLLLIVGLAVVPPRQPLLAGTIGALLSQDRPPDHILIAAPSSYTRFEQPLGYQRWLRTTARSLSRSDTTVEVVRCLRDDGPGTKLLCTQRRARAIAAGRPEPAYLVLVDDDQLYAVWALRSIEAALLRHGNQSVSLYIYTAGGRQGRTWGGLLHVGQAADMLAMPLASLVPSQVDAFYHHLLAYDERFFFHDDLWISMLMQDALRLPVCGAPVLDGAPRWYGAWFRQAADARLRLAPAATGRSRPLNALDGALERSRLNKELSVARGVWLLFERRIDALTYRTPRCPEPCTGLHSCKDEDDEPAQPTQRLRSPRAEGGAPVLTMASLAGIVASREPAWIKVDPAGCDDSCAELDALWRRVHAHRPASTWLADCEAEPATCASLRTAPYLTGRVLPLRHTCAVVVWDGADFARHTHAVGPINQRALLLGILGESALEEAIQYRTT